MTPANARATPDSSIVIAGFASWHEKHAAALDGLRGIGDLVAHAELESYSVLTRLPEPFQIAPDDIADYLRKRYPGRRMALPEAERRALVARFARLSIAGGAVYDGLVALTAAHHGYRLISCDRRAASTYDRLDVEVTYL
ncbi:MAG TPA: PIN domain-containing protein [Solirubrobacteraceae bacterium]